MPVVGRDRRVRKLLSGHFFRYFADGVSEYPSVPTTIDSSPHTGLGGEGGLRLRGGEGTKERGQRSAYRRD